MSAVRHILDIDDLSAAELADVLERSADPSPEKVLAGLGVGLIFEKASARTRSATEMAVVALGGHPVTMKGDEVGIDARETAEDVARTLASYHAAIGARVYDHRVLQRMAAVSAVPVVNLLSDVAHPCQAVADLLTLRERFGALKGLRVAYLGDFNNVARSLAIAAALSGVELVVAGPPGFGPTDEDVDHVAALGGALQLADRPDQAVAGADAVYTDVWVSMGQEDEAEARKRAFEGFGVTESILSAASDRAIFLHCLPAHRGEEVDASVVDGPQSAVWQQAANRLAAARGVLWWVMDASRKLS
ncbi:MAG TPA: ornithine carbamoyltransferase [Acidimicrobiales bacterium]|nr:ornithine carbamoyltransferase [Acidimicrobiales bacterium]